MALNISPGDDAVAQEGISTPEPQSQVAESAQASDEQPATETATVQNEDAAQEAQTEQPAIEGDANSAKDGASEAPVADASEQSPETPATRPEEGQDVAEATQENAAVEQPTPSGSEDAAPASDDDAHDLIDELEDLIGRAHHFENAGIEKLRASGLALIERIRNAI
jgi:hypothetical protein